MKSDQKSKNNSKEKDGYRTIKRYVWESDGKKNYMTEEEVDYKIATGYFPLYAKPYLLISESDSFYNKEESLSENSIDKNENDKNKEKERLISIKNTKDMDLCNDENNLDLNINNINNINLKNNESLSIDLQCVEMRSINENNKMEPLDVLKYKYKIDINNLHVNNDIKMNEIIKELFDLEINLEKTIKDINLNKPVKSVFTFFSGNTNKIEKNSKKNSSKNIKIIRKNLSKNKSYKLSQEDKNDYKESYDIQKNKYNKEIIIVKKFLFFYFNHLKKKPYTLEQIYSFDKIIELMDSNPELKYEEAKKAANSNFHKLDNTQKNKYKIIEEKLKKFFTKNNETKIIANLIDVDENKYNENFIVTHKDIFEEDLKENNIEYDASKLNEIYNLLPYKFKTYYNNQAHRKNLEYKYKIYIIKEINKYNSKKTKKKLKLSECVDISE